MTLPARSSEATVLAFVALSLLGGCRSSPCSDTKRTPPATVQDVAASLEGGSFCFEDGRGGGSFALWADQAGIRKATLDLRVKMRARGWRETGGRNYDGTTWEGFAKGDEEIRVQFKPAKLASFGSRIDRDAAYVAVSYAKDDKKAATKRLASRHFGFAKLRDGRFGQHRFSAEGIVDRARAASAAERGLALRSWRP